MKKVNAKLTVLNELEELEQILPETSAEQVTYSKTIGGTAVTDVKGALDKIASGVGVTGVKGSEESTYRTGDVSLSAANVGAEPAGAVAAHNISETAHSDIRGEIEEVRGIALGKSAALVLDTIFPNETAAIQALIDMLFDYGKTDLSIGDEILFAVKGIVPDLWIYKKFETKGTKPTAANIITGLETTGLVQIGYFGLAETETKTIDLSEYQKKTDNSLNTTNKTVVGAINEVRTTANTASTNVTEMGTNIYNIIGGTTKVGKATEADKWASTVNLGVTVGSGKKADGSTNIVSTAATQAVDGSAAKTIAVTLADSGVVAGDYSFLRVNSKGVVTQGGVIIAYGTTPPANLGVGGLFIEKQV